MKRKHQPLFFTLSHNNQFTNNYDRDGGGVGDTLVRSVRDVDRNISCTDRRGERDNGRGIWLKVVLPKLLKLY